MKIRIKTTEIVGVPFDTGGACRVLIHTLKRHVTTPEIVSLLPATSPN